VEGRLWRAIFSIVMGSPTEVALRGFFEGLDFEKLEKAVLSLDLSMESGEYSFYLLIKSS
jgi:hypothetical protein